MKKKTRTKKKTLTPLLLSTGVALAVAIGLAGSRQQQSQGSIGRVIPSPKPPPTAPIWQTFVNPLAFQAEDLVGLVKIGTEARTLSIAWSYDDVAGQRVFVDENFDLNFWPTAAARISDQRLHHGTDFLVAGKRPSNGNTVIERWSLQLQSLPGSSSGGNPIPTSVIKEVLYDGDVPGKRGVRMMAPMNGLVDHAFVHFDDSDDLYRLDGAGQLALLLSPAQAPALAKDSFLHLWGGRDANGDYVYVYQCRFSEYDDGALILTDLGGDGTIDQWTPIASTEWHVVEALDLVEKYSE